VILLDPLKYAAGVLVPLESVLCTEELQRRPSRLPDYQAENRALLALAQALADSPRTILQTLVDTILEVFQSDSAGISLLTTHDDGKNFYWPAIAGAWKPHIGGGTPRDFSPCGEVLDHNIPLLFRHCERRYTYLLPVMPPIEECLVVPFYVADKAMGAIWAIAHNDRRKFDAEDLRQLVSLSRFASVAYQAQASLSATEQLAAIVESSDDAITSEDLNGVITSWNRGAERLFGYPAREAIGQPVTIIIPSDRLDEGTAVLQRIRRGERVDNYETVCRRKDATLVEISLTVSPVTDARSQIVGASRIAGDISKRKKAEQALQEADRRKNEFLALLAHELRNPLAPISNALQIMLRAPDLDETANLACEMMQRQVRQIVWLVNDLLDVSRISRGTIQLRKGRIELASPVNHAVEAASPQCKSLGHELTVVLPPEPIFLNADPMRLAQVVGNLLNNACKYTDRGGHIWLTVQREGEQAVIRVRDNGIGIAADQVVRIFDMFTQVDTSLERSQSGLGIGLMLVKNLVVMHDGTVEVHSAGLGLGSEFVVRLPIIAESPRPPSKPAGSEPTPVTARRILVVDDNRDSATSLALLLKLNGNETYTAYDGLEAVEAAATLRPDLVLLDIGLPMLNGYEAARRIREQPWGKSMTLVALTGWGQDEDRDKSRDAGFNSHLVKPVDLAVLMKFLAGSGAG